MSTVEDIDFNGAVRSAANALALGVPPEEVAERLVSAHGEETGFLLLQAARVYLDGEERAS